MTLENRNLKSFIPIKVTTGARVKVIGKVQENARIVEVGRTSGLIKKEGNSARSGRAHCD